MIIGVVLLVAVFASYKLYASRWYRFSDNVFGPSVAGEAAGLGGKVGFLMNESHDIKKGDTVEVEQDAGYVQERYNGRAKVIWVNESTVITDKGFGPNTPANPGKIRKV